MLQGESNDREFGLIGITIPIIAQIWMESIQIGYVFVNNVP